MKKGKGGIERRPTRGLALASNRRLRRGWAREKQGFGEMVVLSIPRRPTLWARELSPRGEGLKNVTGRMKLKERPSET